MADPHAGVAQSLAEAPSSQRRRFMLPNMPRTNSRVTIVEKVLTADLTAASPTDCRFDRLPPALVRRRAGSAFDVRRE